MTGERESKKKKKIYDNIEKYCNDYKDRGSENFTSDFFFPPPHSEDSNFWLEKEYEKNNNLKVEEIFCSSPDKKSCPHSKPLKALQEFLDYYILRYNNFYSKRFKNLDLNRNRVANYQVYIELVRKMVQIGQIPHIVYEIYDNETGWIRVGRSKSSPKDRMNWYLLRAFSPNLPKDMANIYYEMAKCKSRNYVLARFEIKVRYIFPNKGEAQIMEEFLTIYRNKAENSVGYDLTINNEYNKIVGDLFKANSGGKFQAGALNPKWSVVPPLALADLVLEGLNMNELEIKFKVNAKTIRRRFKAYGYGIKGKYDLKDARAFLLKPIIIDSFKKGLTQEDFFKYCQDEGIEIFNRYKFIQNKSNDRGAFFRRMLDQIWGTSKHKVARYNILSEYILSAITRPDITPGEAEAEVKRIIVFKYDREFARICRDVFDMNFRQKRDEIFKALVEELALKYSNQLKISLKIAIGMGLCRENDPVEVHERATHWLYEYVRRNYGIAVRKLPILLNPNSSKFKSIKDQVYEYMEENPIARPKEVFENFEGTTIETIRGAVKSWKKYNKNKILQYTITLASKYIKKLCLDNKIESLTAKLLKNFITKENPRLNMEWKGLIAGAIYLACQMMKKPISQVLIAKFIGVDEHTISKRYREIAESFDIYG